MDQPAPAPPPDDPAARRADVERKQTVAADLLDELGCEAVVLLGPPAVAWFTSGLQVRGLFADAERPAVYATARQRWVVCSHADTQRLFDEELDRLGFQVKEWGPDGNRTELLTNLVAGKTFASDRPFPNAVPAADRLRPVLRVLTGYERGELVRLGKLVAHAVEATARTVKAGDTEHEVAGQLGHRLLHRGADPVALSVTADERGRSYRRAGFTAATVRQACVVQATGHRNGLYATAARTVSLGPPPDWLRVEHDLASRVSAVTRLLSRPGGTLRGSADAAREVLAGSPYEFDGLLSGPGYGTGRYAAEELRRGSTDEPFAAKQAVVWQARVGAAAVVDTVLVNMAGADPVTAGDGWPVKQVRVNGKAADVPGVWVKGEG